MNATTHGINSVSPNEASWKALMLCYRNRAATRMSLENPATMVIPLPERAARVTRFLKPYLLRTHFSNKYVSAQVIHTPTATVACSASSQEKLLRPNMESTCDVAAAAKIGKLLGERLILKGIPAVSIHMKREQKYHGKVKAVVDCQEKLESSCCDFEKHRNELPFGQSQAALP